MLQFAMVNKICLFSLLELLRVAMEERWMFWQNGRQHIYIYIYIYIYIDIEFVKVITNFQRMLICHFIYVFVCAHWSL